MALLRAILALAVLTEVSPVPTRGINKHSQSDEDINYWAKLAKEDILDKISQSPINKKVKNVIIVIGDGMGINTITPGRVYKGQRNGKMGEEETLALDKFPYTGLIKTYNTDHQVPDSAGTATAILTGTKTKMGFLGIDNSVESKTCDPQKIEAAKLENIFSKAIRNKKETGIVTTTRITHATPGAGYAATPNRDWESDNDLSEEVASAGCVEIAKQMVYNSPGKDINVLFGGGLSKFLKTNDGGVRKDEDLISTWKSFKSNVSSEFLSSRRDLEGWKNKNTKYVLGLFGDSHLPYQVERDPERDPSFSDMSLAALDRLQGAYDRGESEGFVLLLESGRIDQGHHENYAKKAFEEFIELDRAVKHIMEKVNLEDTLVLVTADHSHAVTMNGYPKRGNNILGYIYEEGVGNYVTLPNGKKIPYSTISYANGPGYEDHFVNGTMVDIRNLDYESDNYKSPSMWMGPEKYETHGGEDVAIFAAGPQSHLFTGVHEQSFITHGILYGMCQIKDIPASFCSSSSKLTSLSPLMVFCIIYALLK
uniref:Alkaline phosphatase n=1 Tax=Caligus clemensi TaxID=344056 RepID=C1C058_CALCM|nr:Alkaline phosphatase, tissue-nonspecific isozyme precursor [Caligus clemensi]